MAMGLPRAGPFVLGIGSELPAVTPNGRMVAHGPGSKKLPAIVAPVVKAHGQKAVDSAS
jgi:hypothetical protein